MKKSLKRQNVCPDAKPITAIGTQSNSPQPKGSEERNSETRAGAQQPTSAQTSSTSDSVDIGRLRPHPLSFEIYGDELDGEFVANVKARGIIEPLIATTDDQIISGHRRWQAAKKVGLKAVPVRRFPMETEDEKTRLLLDSNRQPKKSVEQRLREFEQYLNVESESAKLRQGQRSDIRTNSSTSPPGRARDVAAKKVSLSGSHAETGLKVLDAIVSRQDSDEAPLAEKIRTVLNTDGIHAAHREVLDAGWITKADSNPSEKASAKSASAPASPQGSPAVVTTKKSRPAATTEDSAEQPSIVKRELISQIQREAVRGLERLKVTQIRAFLTEVREFKDAWLKKQEEESRHE